MALPMKTMKAAMKATAMKKAMKKVMKRVMKKVMKKKAMKKSTIATNKRAKASVFRGTKVKTVGGLTKEKLTKNRTGKVVSKAASAAAKKKYANNLGGWTKAVQAARKALGVKGFAAIGGKSAEGKALYAKAKSLYTK
ncbi:unnamed protein product [Polarella glacialis]|uniref:Uncharacterized protein n=1 Tax=Polarella glacialis TaxID=89957 RepID=A0A813E8K9_POLGL|nr:unnamed protein product [Polarella glacialis]CAE8595325.1 unnamed protein product [Polarella glacialis]